MSCINTEGFGEPIAIIEDVNASKKKRNSKNKVLNNQNECQFCYKKTTPANKARHLQTCPVKKAGGAHSNKVIYVNSDPKTKVRNPMSELVVKDTQKVQMIPNKKKERFVSYISGQAGSGKSFFTNKLAEEYHSMYPKRPIYLFSLLTEDKSIKCKCIKRIKLDGNFLKTDLTLGDMKNSLLIFDDIDTIKNKCIKGKLDHIIDTLLQCGRHAGVSVIYVSHLACNGKDTKMILAECNNITIFPKTMGNRGIKYLLSDHFGLDNKQIKKIKKLDSRHITLVRSYPMVLLHEKGAFLLNNLDESD